MASSMTKLERAAIDLRQPVTGTHWLDHLIEDTRRNEIAERLLAGWLGSYGRSDWHPADDKEHMLKEVERSYALADCILSESDKVDPERAAAPYLHKALQAVWNDPSRNTLGAETKRTVAKSLRMVEEGVRSILEEEAAK